MVIYTKEQINNAVDVFSQDLGNMLFSATTELAVQKIGTDAGLLIGQLGTLNLLTNYAILGLLDKEGLEAEIKNNSKLAGIQLKETLDKIYQEVLAPVEDLKKKILLKKQFEKTVAETEARWAAEEKEYEEIMAKEAAELSPSEEETSEYSSEAPVDMPPSEQSIVPERTPALASETPTIEREIELFFPKLIPKVLLTGSQSLHPFEEKMKQVFTGASTEAGSVQPPKTEVPAPAPAQKNTPIFPPAQNTGHLQPDPYREAIE